MPTKVATITGLRGMFRYVGGAFGISLTTIVLHSTATPATGFQVTFLSFGLVLFLTIPALMSRASTWPAGPKASARIAVRRPVPHSGSRTLVPGRISAAMSNRAIFGWASAPKGSTARGAVAIVSKHAALTRSMDSPLPRPPFAIALGSLAAMWVFWNRLHLTRHARNWPMR
jgi:hypothetical protein